jgi:hypothetical protein
LIDLFSISQTRSKTKIRLVGGAGIDRRSNWWWERGSFVHSIVLSKNAS